MLLINCPHFSIFFTIKIKGPTVDYLIVVL